MMVYLEGPGEIDFYSRTCMWDGFHPIPLTVFFRGGSYHRTGRTLGGLRVYRYAG